MHVMVTLLVNESCTCEQDLQLTSTSPHVNGTICEPKAINSHKHLHIPCHTSPGLIIYHAMPARPYYIPCHAHQAIEYTMLFPPGHTTYHAKPARPEHITCHAHQAIPCTMPCTPGYTICQPGHTIYHAMSTSPYHMPVRP